MGRPRRCPLRSSNHVAPPLLDRGEPGDETLRLAAAITARYGKGREQASLSVKVTEPQGERLLEVVPITDERELDRWRVPEKFDSGELLNR